MCPFQSCETERSNEKPCIIICKLKSEAFPLKGNIIFENISDFTFHNITVIPNDSFQGLNISNLILYAENLKKISANSFRGIVNLNSLVLHDLKKKIQILNDSELISEKLKDDEFFLNSVYHLQNLTNLVLRKVSKIKNFVISNFLNLKNLTISSSSIEHFQIDSNLKYLLISASQLKQLNPEMFINMSSLEKVNFDKNKIESLPKSLFSQNTEITYINLRNNKIINIDEDWLSSDNKLNHLDLSNNLIEILNLKYLFKLKYLNLANNFIKVLNFQDLSINSINFGSDLNKSSNITRKPSLPIMEKLLISNNRIENFTVEQLENMPNLNVLDLSKNFLKTIEFPFLKFLKQVNLENNYLTFIHEESFFRLVSLEKLNIGTNRISFIESNSFNNNLQLNELILNSNNLSAVPIISKLLKLNILDLSNQSRILERINAFSFESQLPHSTSLNVFLRFNKISNFSNRIFCSNNLISYKINFHLDNLDNLNECFLTNSSKDLIQIGKEKFCEISLNNFKLLVFNSGYCDLVNLKCQNETFLECDSQNKFLTWLSGYGSLFSFHKYYQKCSLIGDNICLENKNFKIYCLFENIKNLTSVLTKLRVSFFNESKNSTDEKLFFLSNADDYMGDYFTMRFEKPYKFELIVKQRKFFFSIMIKSDFFGFKNSKGLLKSGCESKNKKFLNKIEFEDILDLSSKFNISIDDERGLYDLIEYKKYNLLLDNFVDFEKLDLEPTEEHLSYKFNDSVFNSTSEINLKTTDLMIDKSLNFSNLIKNISKGQFFIDDEMNDIVTKDLIDLKISSFTNKKNLTDLNGSFIDIFLFNESNSSEIEYIWNSSHFYTHQKNKSYDFAKNCSTSDNIYNGNDNKNVKDKLSNQTNTTKSYYEIKTMVINDTEQTAITKETITTNVKILKELKRYNSVNNSSLSNFYLTLQYDIILLLIFVLFNFLI
ncbi:unnamed protein product [Brachionus calyciflorus]|uniref:Chaoptin n=1 Tax=Brachionus calyciflorus TaxID=104777 RepID=A0A813MN44_9BILA|nr:unnamed protein product [Brachionus calyciflorus]